MFQTPKYRKGKCSLSGSLFWLMKKCKCKINHSVLQKYLLSIWSTWEGPNLDLLTALTCNKVRGSFEHLKTYVVIEHNVMIECQPLVLLNWYFPQNLTVFSLCSHFLTEGEVAWDDRGPFCGNGVRGLGKSRYVHLVYPPDTHLGMQKLFVPVQFL